MDPLEISSTHKLYPELSDRVQNLTILSTRLHGTLNDGVETSLCDLVRVMNCYYSNFLEDRNTHPIDIDRAMREDYQNDPAKRNLQLEARSHIHVERKIDSGALPHPVTSPDGLRWIHKEFCDNLPSALLTVRDPESGTMAPVTPGDFRDRFTQVGRHVAISPGAIPRFLKRFHKRYGSMHKIESIIHAGAMHHRLLWIHPFADGNGRVSRLMTQTLLRRALDSGGLWSISRGLARKKDTYQAKLTTCDLTRRNSLDGRGNLSQEALVNMCRFFLEIAEDQIQFMAGLIRPQSLRTRILHWARNKEQSGVLPNKSSELLKIMLYHGHMERSQIAGELAISDRSARAITSALSKQGVLVSTGPRAPWELAFPAALGPEWMPGLFPDLPSPEPDTQS